jgi:hypothetical protein
MNKWAIRLLGLLMILVFLMVMTHLQRQLVLMKRQQEQSTTD